MVAFFRWLWRQLNWFFGLLSGEESFFQWGMNLLGRFVEIVGQWIGGDIGTAITAFGAWFNDDGIIDATLSFVGFWVDPWIPWAMIVDMVGLTLLLWILAAAIHLVVKVLAFIWMVPQSVD